MLRYSHQKMKFVTRVLLSAFALFWIIAVATPCIMALTHYADDTPVHCLLHKDILNTDTIHCESVTAVNCTLPDFNSPIAVTFGDMSVTQTLLTVIPVTVTLLNNGQLLRQDFFKPDIPAPPLYIRHLTLLI